MWEQNKKRNLETEDRILEKHANFMLKASGREIDFLVSNHLRVVDTILFDRVISYITNFLWVSLLFQKLCAPHVRHVLSVKFIKIPIALHHRNPQYVRMVKLNIQVCSPCSVSMWRHTISFTEWQLCQKFRAVSQLREVHLNQEFQYYTKTPPPSSCHYLALVNTYDQEICFLL